MPTYEYQCTVCNHVFDQFQSMSDAPLTECPVCGKMVKRVINGGTGIIFKGSGFYVTDKGSSNKKKTSSDSGSCSKAQGCSTGTTP